MQEEPRPRSGLVIVKKVPKLVMSRIRNTTPYSRGKVFGPQDRLVRDMIGEKLHTLWKHSVEAKRQTGQESGPFDIRDWHR